MAAHTDVRDDRDLTAREALLWALTLAGVEHRVDETEEEIGFADGSTLVWSEGEKKAKRPGWVRGPRRTLEKSRAHIAWDRYRAVHKPSAKAVSDLDAVRWALAVAGEAWRAEKDRVYLVEQRPDDCEIDQYLDYYKMIGVHLGDGSMLVWFEDPEGGEDTGWRSDADLAPKYTAYRSEQDVFDLFFSDPAKWASYDYGQDMAQMLAQARHWRPKKWPWETLAIMLKSLDWEAFDFALERLGVEGIDGVSQASAPTKEALTALFSDPTLRKEIAAPPMSPADRELYEDRLCRIMEISAQLPTPPWPREVVQKMLTSENDEVRRVAFGSLANMEEAGAPGPSVKK
ncbi:MAG: hypothetical protein EA350_05360 [Gemmatimonadales bacterium]|nr:MAG: hypothetical protein EA350_05360 [Gemmatimonadales bacterium]